MDLTCVKVNGVWLRNKEAASYLEEVLQRTIIHEKVWDGSKYKVSLKPIADIMAKGGVLLWRLCYGTKGYCWEYFYERSRSFFIFLKKLHFNKY